MSEVLILSSNRKYIYQNCGTLCYCQHIIILELQNTSSSTQITKIEELSSISSTQKSWSIRKTSPSSKSLGCEICTFILRITFHNASPVSPLTNSYIKTNMLDHVIQHIFYYCLHVAALGHNLTIQLNLKHISSFLDCNGCTCIKEALTKL